MAAAGRFPSESAVIQEKLLREEESNHIRELTTYPANLCPLSRRFELAGF
jgi:hypothetical protein